VAFVLGGLTVGRSAPAQQTPKPGGGCTEAAWALGQCPDPRVDAEVARALPAAARDGRDGGSSPAPEEEARSPGFGHDLTITLGGGLGTRDFYCHGCSHGGGISPLIKISRFVGATTAVGIEATTVSKHAGPSGATMWSAMAVFTGYVIDHSPFFVSGGLGVVGFHQTDGLAPSVGGTGFGCTGRLGYEARISSALALTPYAGYVSTIGGLQTADTRQALSAFQFGLGLTLR